MSHFYTAFYDFSLYSCMCDRCDRLQHEFEVPKKVLRGGGKYTHSTSGRCAAISGERYTQRP